jgi:ribonuclease III
MSLEQNLGYFFFDKRLLNRALTRKAYALEQKQQNQIHEDQEIYRTLGDSVLKTVLTEFLVRSGCNSRQEITTKRIELEREENLAQLGKSLEIGLFIKLGIGEKKMRAHEQPYVLAETLEAIIGAVYLDGGFSNARGVIKKLFQSDFPDEV